MSVESIQFRNQVTLIRSLFAKTDCVTEDTIFSKEITKDFLDQLCRTDLLSHTGKAYCKGSRWINERSMALKKFITVASSAPKKVEPEQTGTYPSQKLQEAHDSPVQTPFLGEVIKSRRSLTMGLKFTKGKELSGVLSWYSSHHPSIIEQVGSEGRRRYYEQEAFEVNGKIYRIIDLEAHLLKSVRDFFDDSVSLKIQRIHRE